METANETFLNLLKEQIHTGETNTSYTDNGAKVYKTTGEALVDINFSISTLRSLPAHVIITMYRKAFLEDKNLALKWLFYLGDIREGQGERRSFRIILKDLANHYPQYLKPFIKEIAFYNRWDSILELLDTPLEDDMIKLIVTQLTEDWVNMRANNPISLLAKWLPRTDVTNPARRRMARKLCKIMIGTTPKDYKEYNKTLKTLRRYLNIVETAMVENKWSDINYSSVPSKANLKYRQAFLRHDQERRLQFLQKAEKGEVKINATINYPYEVVYKYRTNRYNMTPELSLELNAIWNNLKDMFNEVEHKDILVVADGSASMTWGNLSKDSRVTADDVCKALAIYCAERMNGQFKNYFMTFSTNPQLISLESKDNIIEKIDYVNCFTECSNTDIYRVFKLILDTAVAKNMKQEDLPNNILVISDMQFDSGADFNERLFESIANEYTAKGYKLPRLIFWNLCGRTDTIPMIENEYGFMLVSGFSVNTLKLVFSDKLNPYEILVEILNSPRYERININDIVIN